MILERLGFKTTPVHMRVAFGQGSQQWTNHSPSALTDRCAAAHTGAMRRTWAH